MRPDTPWYEPLIWLFLGFVSLYVAFTVSISFSTPEPEPRTGESVYAPYTEQEYHRLLRTHGFAGRIAVLERDWQDKLFFRRNGQRCEFK